MSGYVPKVPMFPDQAIVSAVNVEHDLDTAGRLWTLDAQRQAERQRAAEVAGRLAVEQTTQRF